MWIEAVELLRVELPLAAPFVTASGSLHSRPLVLVRIVTAAGEGMGECAALAEPTYSEEYAGGAEAVLAEHLVPRLLAPPHPAEATTWSLLARLDDVRGHPMAKAALEMALLDASLRAEGRSLASWLGVEGRRVPAGATVGLHDEPARAVAAAGDAVAAGYRRIKVKIAPGRDVAQVRALREAFPEVTLVADANGSYRRSDAAHQRLLAELDSLGLAALEQPLHPDDLAGAVLGSFELTTTVLLDESIASGAALEAAIALGFSGGVSLKPARLGGLLRAGAVLERCRQVGLAASIGGMLESGIGRRAALAFGALDGFELPGEISPTARYLDSDILPQLELSAGELEVPAGAGIAPVPEPGELARRTVRRRTWRAA